MSTDSNSKKGNKKLKALFSVICISIIALGVVVYFATKEPSKEGTVNEATTVEETEITTAVQRSVTVEDTTVTETEAETEPETEEQTTESTSMALTDTNTPYKSFYKYPIDEVVLKGYTEELVKNETMGDYRSHTAVDFKGEAGCEVSAINDGIVLDVYTDEMYGTTVEIDHGGKLVAKYSGFDTVNVSKGSPVMIGEKIGTLGKVPFEGKDENHLHFSTILEGKYVNPLDVMGKTE